MGDDLVSVVIPTYNRAESFVRAVDSVLAQTHQALDVIVVDDGSTDNTAERFAKRYGADPRVRYLRQTNRGVAAARNLGLAAVRGAYVALLDSDDVWKPWKLELQICCLRAIPEAGMVWTDMEAIGPDGDLTSPKYLHTMYSATYRWFPDGALFRHARPLGEIAPRFAHLGSDVKVYWGDIFSQMVMGNMVHTSTVLLRRERVERVRQFNEMLKYSGEDYDFHLRTCREGPVAFVDVSSIEYQIGRTDQLTHRKYAIHMARNFLATIRPVLKRDRDRISLPKHMLIALQAFAYGWIGSEYFELGDHAHALMYIRHSLRYRRAQPNMWALYVLALLPVPVARTIVHLLRPVKRALRAFDFHRQSSAT